MRTIKELLTLLLNEIELKDIIPSGLCREIIRLEYEDIISNSEYHTLIDFIKNHRPKRGAHYNKTYCRSAWYWTSGAIAPRVAWLKHRINKL